jgi:hypothetical protein
MINNLAFYLLAALFIIYFVKYNHSSFTSTDLRTVYEPVRCGQAQGHLPGSDIILTESEQRNLLHQFSTYPG